LRVLEGSLSPEWIDHTLLSRRDFLRLGAVGLGSLIFPTSPRQNDPAQPYLGRIAEARCDVFDRPSLDGKIIKSYWKDMVVRILEATIGDVEPSHNRIWYRLEGDGYAHSGGVQPVHTSLNSPARVIPPGGVLAEVTVPYTDAFWGPGKHHPFAYRLYYESTYWVIDSLEDHSGLRWYRIQDDKWEVFYHAPAEHLRLVPSKELTPLSSHVPPDAKRLEVRLKDQIVVGFEWERPVFVARIASGAVFSNGRFLTPTGTHQTFHKRPSRHMAAGDLASNGYDLPGVPWICYINEKGVAFHGTYWHNDFGRPRSHGCINLTPSAAKWIYRWTLPIVRPDTQDVYENYGTRVDVIE
jgi:hypothetical protein